MFPDVDIREAGDKSGAQDLKESGKLHSSKIKLFEKPGHTWENALPVLRY
jgi:hypothetical protein